MAYLGSSNLNGDFRLSSPRTIILFFDGTSGQYDSTNTNVVKLCALLRKDCPDQQVVYYQPGIGTYFSHGVISPLWTRMASLLDKAVAWYLDEHVMGGYKFLMDSYHAGDKICLFGFSRGAYTARALAGMLDKVGLLPKGNLQQVHFAYNAYTRTDKEGMKLAAGFKQTFSQNVKVDFLGVWDTVQSTGVLISRSLPFTDSNTAIRVFRHALSLDERRARFRPKLYHWPGEDSEYSRAAEKDSATTRRSRSILTIFKRIFGGKNQRDRLHKKAGYEALSRDAAPDHATASDNDSRSANFNFVPEESCATDVLEVWFSGGHCDVGGGNVRNDVDVCLAQIPFRWMVEQIIQSQCGIIFDTDKLSRIGLGSSPIVPVKQTLQSPDVRSGVTPVATDTAITQDATDGYCLPASQNLLNAPASDPPCCYDERSDARAQLFDELETNKLWWLLEVLPVSNVWQDGNREWHSEWRVNYGKGRFIPFQKPKFHHSVKVRMDHEPLRYRPRAIYDHDEVYV